MAVKLDVVNRVLHEFGRQSVSAYTDDPTATLIWQRIDDFLPQLLQNENWVWARRYRVDSTPITNPPTTDWQFAFQFPSDYGRMFRVLDGIEYLIMDNTLCANSGQVRYYYNVNESVFANGDYRAMSNWFCDALALFVAARTCLVTTNDAELTLALEKAAEKSMAKAIMFNGMERQIFSAPNEYDRDIII